MGTGQQQIVILGIGNLLWADEGFGVRALQVLQQNYSFPDNIRLIDGGTQGVYLVQDVRDADVLIVFDAVDYGLEPATVKIVEGQDVPRYLGAKKVSLHQTGFQEVLALAEMMGDYPEKIMLIGVQPVQIEDFGGSLHPQVRAQIQPCIDIALNYLNDLGITVGKRTQPQRIDTCQQGAIADIDRYEAERPSATVASRQGDDRVLRSDLFEVVPRPVPLEGRSLGVGVDHHLERYR